MIVKLLNIKNFRNYDNLKIKFNPKINIIYGNNGEGKTNLLESIYFLALTKSHRSFIDNSLIKKDKNILNVKANFEIYNIISNFEINIFENKKILKKDNNEIKRLSDYLSNINVIIFYPDDLQIIKGSPVERRNFLNIELSQIFNNYIDILNKYNKILKMRNNYLKNNIIFDENYFDIITEHMIDYAIILTKLRKKFINKINLKCAEIYKNITLLDNFYIKYVSNINEIEDKEKLKKMYKNIEQQEKKYKVTLIGPQKDDLEFYVENKNLKNFGSQGQQRLAILAMKLSELEIIKEIKGESPILLLDDVLSEIDIEKRNKLLKYVISKSQVIITTTDLKNIDEKILKKSKKIYIEKGKIKRKGEVNGK